MYFAIPRTEYTRTISFAAGQNEAGEKALSIATLDENNLFMLAIYFKAWHWPGFVYYNGDHMVGAGGKYTPFHIRPRRIFQ